MINENPLVSVIIPTYNRAQTIIRSIRSVLNQSYQNYEIIVVDDGSTDNTEEVIMKMNSQKIKYIKHSHNKGAAAARNTGIKAAKGEYIAFQDSDDEWHPDKLKKQVEIIIKLPNDVGIIYTDMWRVKNNKKYYFSSPHIIPEDGIVYYKALDDYLEGIGLQTTIIRNKCFCELGFFDENFPRLIDYEIFVRFSKKYKFCHIKEPLVTYYYTDGCITSDRVAYLFARILFLIKYFDDLNKDNKILSNHMAYLSHGLINCKYYMKGIKYLYNSFKMNPKNNKILYLLKILIKNFILLNKNKV